MRFSVYESDPGWPNYVEIMAAGKDIEVYLDGEKLPDCITADDVEGFVVVLPRDDGGEYVSVNGCILPERRTGKVGFKVVDRNGRP